MSDAGQFPAWMLISAAALRDKDKLIAGLERRKHAVPNAPSGSEAEPTQPNDCPNPNGFGIVHAGQWTEAELAEMRNRPLATLSINRIEPSEIAVTEEMIAAGAREYLDCPDEPSNSRMFGGIYRAMRALEPEETFAPSNPDAAYRALSEMVANAVSERDAERARAEAAEFNRDFWKSGHEFAEERAHKAEAWARDVDLKNSMLHLIDNERVDVANALKKALAELECVNSDARAQIVRLMAERDEARNLLNLRTDDLTRVIEQITAPSKDQDKNERPHNPFREFGGDRRRVGS